MKGRTFPRKIWNHGQEVPGVAEVLPLLYLHGQSSGDFVRALEQFLGSTAGLSAATVTRLTAQWQDDAKAFAKRSLKDTDYVYLWVDGIHLKVRLEQDKVCLLVMIGVRVDSTKELVALADGFRESSESTKRSYCRSVPASPSLGFTPSPTSIRGNRQTVDADNRMQDG